MSSSRRWQWHGRGFSGLLLSSSFVSIRALGRRKRRSPARCLTLFAAWLLCSSLAQAVTPFDLVIQNGRVIDPESQLDAVRSIGIRDGRVAAISNKPLDAAQVIDATGLVVSPGFINLHSQRQAPHVAPRRQTPCRARHHRQHESYSRVTSQSLSRPPAVIVQSST